MIGLGGLVAKEQRQNIIRIVFKDATFYNILFGQGITLAKLVDLFLLS
jgi:hypothetical protein